VTQTIDVRLMGSLTHNATRGPLAGFSGVFPVLQIPFGDKPDHPVLHDVLAGLVDRLVALGADGLVVLGLGSETWTLTEPERDAVCSTAAEAAAGRVPLVAGIEGATAVATDRAHRAIARGASAVMVLPPQRAADMGELSNHFRSIARTTQVPILLQDSPQITGVQLTEELLVALAEADPLLRAVKIEAPAAGPKVSAVVGAGLEVVAGWGGLNYLETLRRGAVGCMPASDLGPALGEIHRLAATSPAGADELYGRILPLLSYASQSLELLILSAKHALVRLGVFPSATCRPPSRKLDEEEARSLERFFCQLKTEQVPGW
jgi:2-keto-3-deoxy-L-arabinonate dehydratase